MITASSCTLDASTEFIRNFQYFRTRDRHMSGKVENGSYVVFVGRHLLAVTDGSCAWVDVSCEFSGVNAKRNVVLRAWKKLEIIETGSIGVVIQWRRIMLERAREVESNHG